MHPRSPMASSPFDLNNGGYFLYGVPSSYTPGANYDITLNSTSAITFKGGIVYALNETGYRGGSWTPSASGLTQVSNLGCTGDPGNSITHTSLLSSTPLTSVFLGTWTAPAASVGAVIFQGVCVRVETTWFYLTPINVTLTPVPTTALSTAAVTSGSLTTAQQNIVTTASITTEANAATTQQANSATTQQANSATTGQSNAVTTSAARVSSANKMLANMPIIVFAIILICGVFGSS